MSMCNRYYFTKDVYPNYLVIIRRKKKYYSFGMDRWILNYIGFYKKNKYKLYLLKKKKINYLILDELDIIEKEEYVDNNLDKYIYLVSMNDLLNDIKRVITLQLRKDDCVDSNVIIG